MQAASTSSPTIKMIIPALNKARNLPDVYFPAFPAGLHEVILVDGNSVDDTVAEARRLRPDARIVIQDRCGKGNALACGLATASGDIIVMLDADGSAEPAEIPVFVKALLDDADFVKGTRFADHRGGITRPYRITYRMLSILVNALCHTRYSDRCYGFNAFWHHHAPVLGLDEKSPRNGRNTQLSGDGFEIESLINLRVDQAGLIVDEIADCECLRIHRVSNLTAMSEGLLILFMILAERYRSHRRIPPTIVALMALLRAELELTGRRSGKTTDQLSPVVKQREIR